MRTAIAIIIIIVLISSGCNTSDRIIFSSSRNGNSDIFLMDSNGNILKQITTDMTEEWAPVWVGKNEISYLSQDAKEITIFRHNIETGARSSIDHPDSCQLDDKNIRYAKSSEKQLYACKGDIFCLNPRLNTVTNLTSDLSGVANYIEWGINENEVTFTSNHGGDNDIYLLNLETNKLENLTSDPANDERGDVSPDGNLLVFSSDRFEKGNQDIVILNLKNKSVSRVTDTKATELIARWSANQEYIFYGSNMDGNWELYRYEIKKQHITRLTNNKGFDGDPRVK